MTDRAANKIDAGIGSRIREARSNVELSPDILADALGITRQQVVKYELGYSRLPARLLFEIATFFRLPSDWFRPQPKPRRRRNGSGHRPEAA